MASLLCIGLFVEMAGAAELGDRAWQAALSDHRGSAAAHSEQSPRANSDQAKENTRDSGFVPPLGAWNPSVPS